jgi:hypothetical protein
MFKYMFNVFDGFVVRPVTLNDKGIGKLQTSISVTITLVVIAVCAIIAVITFS